MMVAVEAEESAAKDISCVAEAEVVFVAPERTLRRLVSDDLFLHFPHTFLAAAVAVFLAES